ncbi:MAG: SGNH/GDSL hydrolase family protein [Candidatus Rokubacteria bacterium]|nr:SGNH/GDSL hydrolase family protein [Candidatus Rokubacteria bacterium]
MVGRVVAVGAVVILVAALGACTTGRAERTGALPADRNTEVIYVALGDSTVEGIAATSAEHNYVSRLFRRLRGVYPAARVVNLGTSGAISADVVSRQVQRAVKLRPDLVTLSVGPNDITGGVAVADYEKNVDTIFRTLTRETRAVVVVNLLPDLAVTPRFRASDKREIVGALTVQFNGALARKADAYAVTLVDLYTASRAEVPRHPELVASDGYHPSDLGYERWAELMWRHIETRIARR